MNPKHLLFLIIISIFLKGCLFEKKNEEVIDIPTPELIELGWSSFQSAKYSDSEKYFNELTSREDGYLVGHSGLGWTFLRTYKYQNARSEFNKFFSLDSLGVYAPADSLTRDVRAGQTLTFSALSEHPDVITVSQGFVASNAVNNNWSFRFDRTLTVSDIRLLRAVSQVALSNFADAYAMVRLIDPTFETDIATVEGRLALIMKIEELMSAVK